MSASRRLTKELDDLTKNPIIHFKQLTVDDSNILFWTGLIVTDEDSPYRHGAFKVEITFPPEYPFKPPKVILKTRIYHPNVDEKGQICLSLIDPQNWKPATKIDKVIQELVALIHDPQPDHPLRANLAEEFKSNRKKFNANAEEHTKKFALQRPS